MIANIILIQLIIQEYHVGVYHKGSSNAIGRTSMFDVSNDYEMKVVPERNNVFLANVM